MIELDVKDRKILYQLDLDARQSLTQIGKKVNLPKNVVQYRIKRLEDEGVIKKYYTVIDTFRLGYISFRMYYSFQYTKDELQHEIIDFFVKNTDTYWIASTEGRYNLVVIVWVKDPCRFYMLWQASLRRYRDYFQDKDFSFYFQLFHFRNSFLLPTYDPQDRTKYEVIGCGQTIPVDELDIALLRTIASQARLPMTTIAQEVNSTIPTVNSRLTKLKKSGIIQGFRTEFDLSKLGYKQFKVDIEFKDYSKIDAVTGYLRENPHLYYITKTAGHADLEPTFRVQELNEMHEIMDDLNRKFPGAFKNYHYFHITKMHKLEYMPMA
ncbi:MAG: AsnC family transcriptional regulator [Candidatus Thermoplasmatota archaeon]|nr:AsnC family transcriptional regulator [Candidatus Thermoplasmatota archaeon]